MTASHFHTHIILDGPFEPVFSVPGYFPPGEVMHPLLHLYLSGIAQALGTFVLPNLDRVPRLPGHQLREGAPTHQYVDGPFEPVVATVH